MRNYYRVMLGRGSMYADECLRDGFIGAGYGIKEDLTPYFSEDWREFNKALIPTYLSKNPEKQSRRRSILWSTMVHFSRNEIRGHSSFT